MNKKNALITFIIFLLVGLIFVGLGLYVSFFSLRGRKPADATITKIDADYRVGGDDYDYTVYVKYTVDGKEYNSFTRDYKPTFKEGKEIRIFYDPADPSGYVKANMGLWGILFIVIGAVAFLISFRALKFLK